MSRQDFPRDRLFWPLFWAVLIHLLLLSLLFVSFSSKPELPPARPIVKATLYQLESQNMATQVTPHKIAGEAEQTRTQDLDRERLEQQKREQEHEQAVAQRRAEEERRQAARREAAQQQAAARAERERQQQLAAEKQAAEEQRRQVVEQQRKAAEEKRQAEQRAAEQKKLDMQRAEAARLKAAEEARARAAAERKKAEETRQQAEAERKRQEEQQREAERKRQAEAQKAAEAKKQAEAKARAEAERKKAEEAKRQAEAERKKREAEQAARVAAEQAREAQRRAEEDQRAAALAELLGDGPVQRQATAATQQSEQQRGEIDSHFRQLIIQNWSRPASARNGMQVDLDVEFLADGTISRVVIARSSGDVAFDNSALAAVRNIARVREIQNLDRASYEQFYRKRRLKFRPEDLSQ